MYNILNDVFEEAVKDHASTNLNGTEIDARMCNGIKIIRHHGDNSIEIFNTAKGGDYYRELKDEAVDQITVLLISVSPVILAASLIVSKA